METGVKPIGLAPICLLDDCWLKSYVHMARKLTDTFGIEGEAVLRQGIRNFGKDRGETLRNEQLALGMKINMLNLWTNYDLPDDPRFKRNKIRLTEEERISETLECPMASMWIGMGAKEWGAIYCDEFHPSMFAGYHPGIVTNLGETLTHDTDDHCHFALYLRPGNLTPEERKQSFPAYDPAYDASKVGVYVRRSARDGYNMLTIKLYTHLAKEILAVFGPEGEEVVRSALKEWAEDCWDHLAKAAEQLNVSCNATFLDENLPVYLDMSRDALWRAYPDDSIQLYFKEEFIDRIASRLAIASQGKGTVK